MKVQPICRKELKRFVQVSLVYEWCKGCVPATPVHQSCPASGASSDGAQNLCSATQPCRLLVCGHPRQLSQHLWRAVIQSHVQPPTSAIMITVYHAFQRSKGQSEISAEFINLSIKRRGEYISSLQKWSGRSIFCIKHYTSSCWSRTDPGGVQR